jgi:hypothetical protein
LVPLRHIRGYDVDETYFDPHQRSLPRDIQTPMVAAMLEGETDVRNERMRDVPAKRLGNAEEVASAVLRLSSPAAQLVTGTALPAALNGSMSADARRDRKDLDAKLPALLSGSRGSADALSTAVVPGEAWESSRSAWRSRRAVLLRCVMRVPTGIKMTAGSAARI